MSSEWNTIKLKDFADINPRRTIIKNSLVPYIEMSALPMNDRDIPVFNIGTRLNKSGGGSKFQNGDTLLARITPCLENGKTGLVQTLKNNECGLGSTEFIVLGPRSNDDINFLYYLSKSPEFRDYAIARMEGTSGRQRVSRDTIGEYRFLCPPIIERKTIGALLAALDDRIALLRETNATLESIAQAIFKSWFIDFDPVKAKQQGLEPQGMDAATAALFPDAFQDSELGPIPARWDIAKLEDVYDINPSRKLKKGEIAPYLGMSSVPTSGHSVGEVINREMASGTKFINGDTLLARITPCLENGKTAYVDFLDDEQVGWGSTEFIVLKPKAPFASYHAYLLCRDSSFRTFAIQSMSGTSGRQRVQNDVLGSYRLVLPSEEILTAFSDVIEPIQKAMTSNHKQSQTLVSIRDTLLPRLISGKLRLPEAEAMAGEAGL